MLSGRPLRLPRLCGHPPYNLLGLGLSLLLLKAIESIISKRTGALPLRVERVESLE